MLLFSFDAQLYQFGYGANVVDNDDNDIAGNSKTGTITHAKQCIHIPVLLPVKLIYPVVSQQHSFTSIYCKGPRHIVEAEILSIDPMGRAGTVLMLLANSKT